MKSYLSLGSNEGNKSDNLQQAIDLLAQNEQIQTVRVSSLYETEPWGGVPQPSYYNLAVEIETTLGPYALLKLCQSIENKLGRKRLVHWGSRTLDIDILTYERLEISTETLTIPHPFMEEREFVLAPLRELAPELVLASGQTVQEKKGEGTVKKISF